MQTKRDTLRKLLCQEDISASPWAQWATVHEPLRSPSIYSMRGRRLNNFCVGSDPEFAFSDNEGQRREAFSQGLRVGLVAGCDQNERLVELRPWPSRSVVEHVAGILTALRWLSRVYNPVMQYSFRAGAFFEGDGMGGHVHFGRKRPTRPEEVAALDVLATTMRLAGMFPTREWQLRIDGDQRGQRYGLAGDFRVQAHGYEYRTLPSWLQSPSMAFTVLTASKLTVLEPALVRGWKPKEAADARALLIGLAKYYRSQDDDAYLMYHILTQRPTSVFVVMHNWDFAPAWGLSKERDLSEVGTILPASIKPSKVEVGEVLEHLITGAQLGFHKEPPTFPIGVPNGYMWLPSIMGGGRHHGFGDILHNMVMHNEHLMVLGYANDNRLTVQGILPKLWNGMERDLIRRFFPRARIAGANGVPGGATALFVPRVLCEAQTIAGFRAILFNSGLFPLWTVNAVTADSYALWLKDHSKERTTEWRNC